jgi:hypothetical protein
VCFRLFANALQQGVDHIASRDIKKKGKWVAENETVWLITSLLAQQASPQALLGYNRQH